MPDSADSWPSCQERFHRRWHWLTDPHVRALAWLIDAPSLLDPAAPQWAGRIAELASDAADAALTGEADRGGGGPGPYGLVQRLAPGQPGRQRAGPVVARAGLVHDLLGGNGGDLDRLGVRLAEDDAAAA